MAKTLRTTSALAVVVMVLVGACSSSTATPSPASAAPAATPAATPAASASAAASEAASAPAATPAASAGAPTCPRSRPATPSWTQALGADKPYNGKKVSIQTQWTGGEGEGFAAAIKDFQTATGIAVQVDSIGSSHETVLKTRIEGGSPPDMAALAQPTGVLAYAKEGKVIDIAHRSWTPRSSRLTSRRPSASPAMATTSGASRPRPTSSR